LKRIGTFAGFTTGSERMEVASEFLRGGLDSGQRAIYICCEERPDEVQQQLTHRGIPVAQAEAAGSLVIGTASETYLKDGVFLTERMLTLLNETVEGALNDGFVGVRVCADMSWVLDMAAVEDVLAYEALCNQFVTSCRATGLCLFDRARFPPALLEGFGKRHSWTGARTGIGANPHYEPSFE
jgi:two-component system, chemotaxis family, sensor kinase Cph1